ncbi:MAG: hypothetical protein RL117_1263 [Verrucomicrobiota bacterium]
MAEVSHLPAPLSHLAFRSSGLQVENPKIRKSKSKVAFLTTVESKPPHGFSPCGHVALLVSKTATSLRRFSISHLPSPISHLPSPISHLPSPISHLPSPISQHYFPFSEMLSTFSATRAACSRSLHTRLISLASRIPCSHRLSSSSMAET